MKGLFKAIILYLLSRWTSVSNEILSQLSSLHRFIHRIPAKLSNRIVPYGISYSSCLSVDSYWLYDSERCVFSRMLPLHLSTNCFVMIRFSLHVYAIRPSWSAPRRTSFNIFPEYRTWLPSVLFLLELTGTVCQR